MRDVSLATFPVTLTMTVSTPRRGWLGRRLRPLGHVTTTVDVPLPMDVTPEGVTEGGGSALVRVVIDEEALAADLQERVDRAAAEFTRSAQ